MFMIMSMLTFILLISIMLIILNNLFSFKYFYNREKSLPLECGFSMMNKKKLPFSIQFYFISILFLIFDIEITLIFPMIQKISFLNLEYWTIIYSMFMLILTIGLIFEWKNNFIKWMF